MELISMAISLYAGLLFIRGLVDWVGTFRANVVVEVLHRATDPAVKLFQPLFKMSSPFPGILGMVLLLMIKWTVLSYVATVPTVSPWIMASKEALEIIFQVLFWWILAYVILSWIGFPPHPAVEVLVRVASGLLRPIRRLVPSFGGLDLSPIVLIIGIQMVGYMVMKLLIGLAN